MIDAGSNTSLTHRPRLTEANLSDSKFAEGIDQLRSAVYCQSLTKGDAGIHVIGSLVLKSLKNDSANFVDQLVETLNTVCDGPNAKFRASYCLGPSDHKVLSGFASDKNVDLIAAGWLELVDCEERQTDKRLLGVFMLPNGRRGVGVFQVLH